MVPPPWITPKSVIEPAPSMVAPAPPLPSCRVPEFEKVVAMVILEESFRITCCFECFPAEPIPEARSRGQLLNRLTCSVKFAGEAGAIRVR